MDTHTEIMGAHVFLIPEQESEPERWDVPPPRPRAPSGQRRVFSAGVHVRLLRERGLSCFHVKQPSGLQEARAHGWSSFSRMAVLTPQGKSHLCTPKSNP